MQRVEPGADGTVTEVISPHDGTIRTVQLAPDATLLDVRTGRLLVLTKDKATDEGSVSIHAVAVH